jgi:ATP-binding cassette, subfamily B, multidrug efflux pump
MKKILNCLKPYKLLIFIVIIFIVLEVLAELALPSLMSFIIDKGIVNNDLAYIFKIGFIMLIIALVGGLVQVVISYLSAKIGVGFASNLRNKIFTKVETFSLNEFATFGTNSLITRTTNDVNHVSQAIIMFIRIALMAPIMGIGGVFMALRQSISMSRVILIGIIVIIAFVVIIFNLMNHKFTKLQGLIDKLNLVTREILTGTRVIRAFNNEKYQEEKFKNTNEELTDTNLFINRLGALIDPTVNIIFDFITVGILWTGAIQINLGSLQVGELIAFAQYASLIMTSFIMVSMLFVMAPRAMTSAKRIKDILELEPVIKDKNKPKKLPHLKKWELVFKNVTFSYPNSTLPVLKDISFAIKSGETLAIIGSTGSGKSSIINLIPRFYDISEGLITINGINIKDLKIKELRDCLGYIPQKSMLFSGTISENIKYASDQITDEQMLKAAKISNSYEFIKNKEKKFTDPIIERGSNLSGGEQQRIQIARAIASDPKIYIFDDSFSALDFKTDKEVRKNLKSITKDKIIIIVAQRIGTIKQADKILVLDEGEVVGYGQHHDLLLNCPVYKEIALSQLSEEELL